MMLANLYRKLNKRQIILLRFAIEKNTSFAIQSSNTPLFYCTCLSAISKCPRNENYFTSVLFKNIVRHNTNIAVEDHDSSVKIDLPSTSKILITDEEVKNLLHLNWTSISSAEFVTNFEKLSIYINTLNERPEINYNNLLEALSNFIPNFCDEDISNVLLHLQNWIKNKHVKPEMVQIIQILDAECMNRFRNMSRETQFHFCKLFCNTRYGKSVKFTAKVLLKASNKVNSMATSQLIQFLHLLTICTNLPVNFYEIEYKLETIKDSLSVEDFSFAALAFFKNKRKIRSPNLILYILKSILNNIEIITNEQVNSFSRFLRFNFKPSPEGNELMIKIVEGLGTKVDKFSLFTLTYISSLVGHALIYDKNLMTSIIERYQNNFHQINLKGIQKLLFALTSFNYDPSHSFYQKIVEELNSPRRQMEIEEHRKVLLACLKYLAVVNIYPINLLEKVMDPQFIKKAYVNKYAMDNNYYYLDQSIEAEVPFYTGPRLNDDLREFLAERCKGIVESKTRLMNISKTTIEIVEMCQRLLNTTSGIYTDKLLPQFNFQDIVICFDEKNNLISPEPFLSAIKSGSVKTLPEEAKNFKWLVLILTDNGLIIQNSQDFNGTLNAKIRQLKSLGYIPRVVLHKKWYELKNYENCEELRENYIKELLNIE